MIQGDSLPAGREAQGGWRPPPAPPLPLRLLTGLVRFARRKPLGAFGGLIFLSILLGAAFAPQIAPYGQDEYVLKRGEQLQGPSWDHIMGTDQLGRDVFSRLLYGSTISAKIGLGVFLISSLLSTSLTLISAYYVTSLDLFLQRFVELWAALPNLIVLTSLMALYGSTPLTLIVTLGVLGGFSTSRVLRGLVIQTRAMPYIEAARTVGASDTRVLLRYILPNVMYLIIIGATGAVAGAMTIEAGLAVIGFGLPPNYPTWGSMINTGREYLRIAPHMAIFPIGAVALTLYGASLLGDALRDVLDPRLRGRGQR